MAFTKNTGDDYPSLSKGWAKGVFHRVYLFAGPDTLTKEEAVQELKKVFLTGDDTGMNADVFDGETAEVGAILSAIQTLPFLGGRRMVVVRRAQELAASEANALADGIGNIPAANCLVLQWDEKADNRTVLVQAVKSAGAVCTFWIPFENQMPGWVVERAGRAGKAMDAAAARALLDAVGADPAELAQEVEKLALYVKDRPAVTAADVAAASGRERGALQFLEFDRALWTRNRARVLSLAQSLLAQGQPPVSLLPQISRAYQRLFLGKALLAEKTDKMEMWGRLWIKTRQPQEEFMRAQADHGWDELLDKLSAVLDAEWKAKTGRSAGAPDLTRLLFALTEN